MIVIFSGLPGSGKSLKLAQTVIGLLYRNHALYQKALKRALKSKQVPPKPRLVYTNLKMSPQVEKHFKGGFQYWSDLRELTPLRDCDVVIDEVGNYFDSRMWTELSLDVRRWLTQGAKSGIEIYGSAQDFAQVDKAFRRLVNHLFHIVKLFGSRRPSATKPPVKRIWGLCSVRELDPQSYDEDKKKFAGSGVFALPSFFFIERVYCEIFDTSQVIQKSRLLPFRHQERECELNECSFHKVSHI